MRVGKSKQSLVQFQADGSRQRPARSALLRGIQVMAVSLSKHLKGLADKCASHVRAQRRKDLSILQFKVSPAQLSKKYAHVHSQMP